MRTKGRWVNGDYFKGQKWDIGKNRSVTTKTKAKSYRREGRRNVRENIREKACAKKNS